MKLREQLLKEHSKENRDAVVKWIGASQPRFNELFALFLQDEYRVVQRASWALSYAAAQHPVFITKQWGPLLKNLSRPGIHDAVKRNTLRLLQHIPVPVKYQGQLMDRCFQYIIDPKEKAAIKAFSLTILENLLQQYPDIGPELKTIIEEQWEHAPAAFRSRAKKLLKKL